MNYRFSLIGINQLDSGNLGSHSDNEIIKGLIERVNYIHYHLEEREIIERFGVNSGEHMSFKSRAGIKD